MLTPGAISKSICRSLIVVVGPAFAVGLLGCAAEPLTAYNELQQVDEGRISYTFTEAITAATPIQIVKNIEAEIALESSDLVFDAGWTFSYYKSLRFDGIPGARYRCRVRSTCSCFGFMKTLVLPYMYVISAFGDSLGEGPDELVAREPTLTLPIHLEGRFDFVPGENGSCYLLIIGDNREPGSPSTAWEGTYLGSEGEEFSVRSDVVASPVGTVRVLIEEAK